MSAFQSIVYSSNFHILAITKTWLSGCIFDNELLPSGYSILLKDRSHHGGGVLFAIDLQLTAVQLDSPNDLEVLTVKISSDHPVIVCVVYVPSSFSSHLLA